MSIIEVNSLLEIKKAAKELLSSIDKNKVVAFYGNMGAGKTTLIKAICEELGVIDTVTSPTFSLINEYETKEGSRIYHFDFYRIETIEEIYDFGYEEYFYSGNYCFIEWPEKIESHLPEGTAIVKINVKLNNTRSIAIVSDN